MALIVTYDSPAMEDGAEVEVVGLGILKNREPLTLTEDQERNFAMFRKETISDVLKSDGNFTLSGTAILSGSIEAVTGVDFSSISDSVIPDAVVEVPAPTPAPVEVLTEVKPPVITSTRVDEGGDS